MCDEYTRSYSGGFKIENYNSDECPLRFFASAVTLLGEGPWKCLAMMLNSSSMLIKQSSTGEQTRRSSERFLIISIDGGTFPCLQMSIFTLDPLCNSLGDITEENQEEEMKGEGKQEDKFYRIKF